MSEERFDRIEQRLDQLEYGQIELKEGQTRLQAGQDDVRSALTDLDRHMHVLHEDVVARIAAIPEYTGPTKAEFAELKEMIGRRLDPLDAAIQHHNRGGRHVRRED